MGYIYKITNSINGKVYIGQTTGSLEKRWREHSCASSSNHCSKLKRAISKYGKASFSIDELAQCHSLSELNEMEIFYIKSFKSISRGYNLREGGTNSRMTPATKRKISKSNTGKKRSAEALLRLSESHKGFVPTAATLEKKSRVMKEKWKSPEYRKNAVTFGQSIYQFDLHGNLLKKWDNASQAYKALGMSSGSISEVLNKKRKVAGGYLWGYADTAKPYPTKSVYFEVLQKKNGEVVARYSNIQDASERTKIRYNSIKRVCNGGRVSTGGFSFEYAESFGVVNKFEINNITITSVP